MWRLLHTVENMQCNKIISVKTEMAIMQSVDQIFY